MISAAVARWTGGSEVVDPVERAFAGAEPLCVEAVIPEAGVGPLHQKGTSQNNTCVFVWQEELQETRLFSVSLSVWSPVQPPHFAM